MERCRIVPAGHEDEDVAVDRLRDVYAQRSLDGSADVVLLRGARIVDLHREGASGDLKHRHAAKKARKLVRVERGRRDHEPEVPPHGQHLHGSPTVSSGPVAGCRAARCRERVPPHGPTLANPPARKVRSGT